MSVRIITDSASDMSPVEHPALAVLPLSVTFGTDVYMDGIDIDHQRFYEMLVERDELPKTGQVNPYAFSQAIAKVREAGDEAVIITVGAKLSGTNQSARTALAEAPGGDVYVVDSNNVTLGERVLVEYALRLVNEGRSAAQIAAAVEAVRDRVVVIGLLETLEYLVRGGRLSAAAGELAYIDDAGAVCRCWNWRDGVRTALSDDSADAFLAIECVEPERMGECQAAIDRLAELLERCLGATVVVKTLVTRDNPCVEL